MPIPPSSYTTARRLRLALLLGPAVGWLILFFLIPLAIVALYSFLTRSATGGVEWIFTLANFGKLFSDSVYLIVFWRSMWMALLTTLLCLLIGYPLALFIARQSPRWRTILIFLLLIPFWTNFLVRTYAWMALLNTNGMLNSMISAFGGAPVILLNTQGAVLLGLVYGQLPFMALPIYASIDRFDFSLLEAAGDLGAGRRQAFLQVLLPLTLPGIAAGSVLSFIPAAGNYIVPVLLGGGKIALIGNLLETQFRQAQNPPLGSATAMLVMILLTVGVALYFRVTSE